MDAKQLKEVVKRLGPTAVHRESGVAVQTIDTWANKDSARMLSPNYEKVEKAVIRMLIERGEYAPQASVEEYLDVPVYDIRAAAGAGAIVEDGSALFHEKFRINFIERLTRAPLSMLSIIEAAGDSMEPTIHSGDLVMVDHTVRSVAHGGIYIIRVDGANFVKRCHKSTSNRSIHVISDNPKYPVDIHSSADDVEVIGRVIWIGRALR